jgi:DNA-binding NarL/FixJ family response regulator
VLFLASSRPVFPALGHALARLLIVDDYEPFRKGLRSLIESNENWKVVCEAADGGEAVEKHGQTNPCLTVMDFNMPGLDGLTASRRILNSSPSAVILMVSVFSSSQLINQARQVGIRGFCSKTNTPCITEAIEALLQGKTYFQSFLEAGA